MTTKKIISEQVLFRLKGGYPSVASSVQEEDVWKATEQLCNSLFKLEQFQSNLPSGETIPMGLCLAEYTVPVSTNYSVLPVMPVSLPRNLGVYHISKTDSPNDPFIPIQTGQFSFVKDQPLINDLLGQVGYEVVGNKIKYTSEPGVDSVLMRLVVMDISQYSETDMLPVPSDIEEMIVEKLVEKFSGVFPADKINDSSNEPSRNQAR